MKPFLIWSLCWHKHPSQHILTFQLLLHHLLQTDVSAVRLGAVLEQGGHVIAYASHTLTKSASNYSVIQRNVWLLYLVWNNFTTTFYINDRSCTTLMAICSKDGRSLSLDSVNARTQFWYCISQRLVIKQIHDTLSNSPNTKPTNSMWMQPLFKRYLQIWHQLSIVDGVVCHTYKPGLSQHSVTVPLLPDSLHKSAIYQSHNIPTSRHQGTTKTLKRLQQVAYWVEMAKAVAQYCSQCVVCQQAKLPTPTPAPMTNVPIGGPWQMLAADILEVPISRHHNRYLLVFMDYFTKWAEAIPLRDQTAASISAAVIEICCSFGVPNIVH